MKIDKLIAQLQQLKATHGNLDVFDTEDYGIEFAHHEDIDPKDYPKDWNMPKQRIVVGAMH